MNGLANKAAITQMLMYDWMGNSVIQCPAPLDCKEDQGDHHCTTFSFPEQALWRFCRMQSFSSGFVRSDKTRL